MRRVRPPRRFAGGQEAGFQGAGGVVLNSTMKRLVVKGYVDRRFIQHDRLRAYVQEALKTWRCAAEADAVARVVRSRWVIQGPEVAAFEGELAAAVGASHAVANCVTTHSTRFGDQIPTRSPGSTSTCCSATG